MTDQTGDLASYDLNVTSGAPGINVVLPAFSVTLQVTVACQSYLINNQRQQFWRKTN